MSRTWNEHHKAKRNVKTPSYFLDDDVPRKRKTKPYGGKKKYNIWDDEDYVNKSWERQNKKKFIEEELYE